MKQTKMIRPISATFFRKTIFIGLFTSLWVVQSNSVGPGQNPVVSCHDGKKKILCLPKDYSKFDLPYRHEYNVIDIGIEISDVLKIDDKDYSITFSLYFNVQWSEPRLNLSHEFFTSENITEDDHLVPVNLELIHDLWLPNIFIYNLKTFKVIDVLSKLAGLWINSKKEIYYSQATHITFICPMLFDSFPLDIQVCKFQVGSYSYDMTKMIFRVSKLTFIQKQSIILDYSIGIRNLHERDKIFLAGALGNYSLAGFEMNLQRHVMSYIITYYLPSGLFVVVSWISFLIPPDIVPGRMALLITLFLVLINIFNNITTNSPKAEGLTAIEIWMLACILFVFGALIEYALILFKKQKVNKYGIPSQSALVHKASIAAQRVASDTPNLKPVGVVTTRLLPGTTVNYSTGTTCCMNHLGSVQDDHHDYYLGGHILLSPSEISHGCCASPIFLSNSSRSQLYWHNHQNNQSGQVDDGRNSNRTTCSSSSNRKGQEGPPNGHTINILESGGNSEEKIPAENPKTPDDQSTEAHHRFVTENPCAHLAESCNFGPRGHCQTHNLSMGLSKACRHHQRIDSLKRRRRQSVPEKQYSTWHDKYYKIDRFFLICSPVLFGIFNIVYWGYFYVWNEVFRSDDGEDYF